MNEELQTEDPKPKSKDLLWLISCVLVTAIASFLRFFWLELKPLHHDEGVNGYFLTTLFRNGEYKYDPANYHGPDLYYIALAFTKTFGLNTMSIRSSVAIFGVLIVVLAFFLKKYIGKTGSIFAALFLALSPGMVYISRYFIHEILFVFFSFAIAISVMFFIERRKAGIGAIAWTSLLLLICFLPSVLNLASVIGGENVTLVWVLRVTFFLIEVGLVVFVINMLIAWKEGQPIYLILASASAILLFATKETAFITIGTMAISCVCVWLWNETNSGRGFFFYLAALKNYAKFSGRTNRKEFWTFLLFNLIFSVAAIILDNALGITAKNARYGLISSLYFLATFIPNLAVTVRRLHDTGNSGSYIFLPLIPIFGNIWQLVLLVTEGNEKKNKYGENPNVYTSEVFSKNKFWIFLTPTIIALVAVAVKYQSLKERFSAITESFLSLKDDRQTYLFYGILALITVTTITWLAFMLVNRKQTETDLAEDAQLNWTNFREKLAASDNWELIFVKSALGGASIALVWLFVRYAIDLVIAIKAGKTLLSAIDKINLGNVDAAILAIAFLLLALAVVVWLVRKPIKVSTDLVLMMTSIIIVFLYVGALFFSSFFTYPEGLKGAFEAYAIWTKTGNNDHTQNGFWAYVRWGMILESPLLILSTLGVLIAMFKAKHRFAMFTAFWAFGLFVAYTIIPYKTPWLALSFLLPMCIVAGYAINELLTSKNIGTKILGGVLAVLATCILAFQTYDLNFERYDSDAMPYIYAHTTRGFLDLTKKIEYYADKSGQGKNVKIEIISPDYWPMPWYMNDYPNAVFEGKPVDANSAEMIIAKKDEQDSEIISRYAQHYKYDHEYPLRPGVNLILLVRKDLANPDAKDIYSLMGEPLTITPADSEDVQNDSPVEDTESQTPKK